MTWKHLPLPLRVTFFAIFILLSIVTVAPLIYLVSLSLSQYSDTYNVFLWPNDFQIVNYQTAWESLNLGRHYFNSIYITLSALAINLLFGSLAAFAIARFKFPLREPIYNMFLAGLILSAETMIIPLFLNAKLLGFINKWYALPIVYATIGLPFTILIFRSFFETLPKEIIASARIDGCNTLQIYWLIMLPLSRSAFITVGLFQFIWYWDEFILAISLISNHEMRPLTGGLSKLYGEYFIDYPVMGAALVTTIIPVVVVYIVFQRSLLRGMTMGAVK